MSQRTPACDELLAEMRADATLRALAELDSLEPPRALDRGVLGQARHAVSGRAHRATAQAADARRLLRAGPALRWGIPTAVAAAAVCAIVVHLTGSRSGAARVSGQFLAWQMQPSASNALEMVRVSARYRGAGPRVGASATPAYLAPSGSGESQRALIPSFIEASAPLLSISAAPLRKRGSEEWRPPVATRTSERDSSARDFLRQREWTRRRQIRPPELIESAAVAVAERSPPPPPGRASPSGSSGRGPQIRPASTSAGAPAAPR